MSNTKQKIDDLLAELRAQKQAADLKLEKAIQKRELIAAMPVPRREVQDSLSVAVNTSAQRFEKTLLTIVQRRARKRDAIGVQKTPDVIREMGDYSRLNVDAINYFFGDVIMSKLNEFVENSDFFGVADGIPEVDYQKQLASLDAEIDVLKADQQALTNELNAILR